MKKKILTALRVLTVLVLGGLLASSLLLHQDNIRIKKLLSQQRFATLSPDMLRLVVSDLESREPSRIKPWASYFQHLLDLRSNPESEHLGFEELLALHRSREAPARSNYFAHLVQTLSARQQTVGLTKTALLGYLGQPDTTERMPGGEVLLYHFESLGRPATAVITTTNDTVTQVMVSLDTPEAQAPDAHRMKP